MTKEERKNVLTWLLLCIISFTLFVIGFSKNKEGYGTTGNIRKDLTPIAETFNNIRNIKNTSFPVNAKYKNKKIIVNYEHPSEKIKLEFIYKEDKGVKQLYTTYSKAKEKNIQIIVSNMVEAISILQGNNEGAIFKKYKYENFYTTKENHGFNLVEYNGQVTATIAIHVNLLKQIEDLFFEETNITYISYDDLKDLKEGLEKNKTFEYNKGDIKLYIIEQTDKYIIYCSDKNNNSVNLYNSIMSAVNILEPTIYNDISRINLNIMSDIIKTNYQITINPTKVENNFDITGNPLIQFTLKKQTN